MKKEQLTKIDIIRIIAAISVVVLHCFREETGFMNVYGAELIERWAVAFFFLVSGFFMKRDFPGVAKYCIHILVMYFFWTIVYALVLGDNIFTPWNFFVVLRNGIIMPFWYFPSLIMCTLFVWILTKVVKNNKLVVFVCAALYIVALLGDTFNNVTAIKEFMDTYFFPVFERIMGVHDTRDGIFNGSLFIAIGVLLKEQSENGKLTIVNKKKFYFGFAVVVLMYILEICVNIYLQLGNRDVLMTTPFMASCIFVIGYNSYMDKDKSIYLREMSSVIYVIHYMFLTYIQRLTNIQIVWFLVTAIGSLAVAAVFVYLSRKIKVLKYII